MVFPFIKENGRLYLRNHLDVDWKVAGFDYKIKAKGMTITIKMAGDTLPINIDPVISSGGVEKSDRPICVYQEQEYQRLQGLLERYRSLAKG